MDQGFEDFRIEIKEEIEQICGEGLEVSIENVVKNNGVLRKGIALTEKGGTDTVIIYLEQDYKDYQKGISAAELAGKICGVYGKGRMTGNIIPEGFGGISNYESVRGEIVYRLVNYARNKEQLEAVPYIRFCDLAIVFCVPVETKEGYHANAIIQREHAERWGIDAKELFRIAAQNTPRIFPVQIRSMMDVMREIVEVYTESREIAEELMNDLYPTRPVSPLYVMENQAEINGAAVILYPGVLRQFADRVGKDLVILPSSIHEVLVIPWEPALNMRELKEMVILINRAEVGAEDYLSDQVYLYRRDTDQVTQVFEDEREAG